HGIASRSRALSKRSTNRGSPPWRINLVIDSVRLTADITECSRAALTVSHPCSRRTSAITAELSSTYRVADEPSLQVHAAPLRDARRSVGPTTLRWGERCRRSILALHARQRSWIRAQSAQRGLL